ncbi:hypothetical protein [Microbacterium marmarense]|uniref:Uncharacterized protein n=1 Tax=Microbacterium marmarense TaxID=3122051 RepID=A0ABU8LQJ5_9MICO
MLASEIPQNDRLLELMDHRDDASVTIAIASSPMPADHERIRIGLRNAIDYAERHLTQKDVSRNVIEQVVAPLRALNDDDDFWRHQSRSLVILAAPEILEAFRIANVVEENVAVGDRFDIGALLRASAFAHRAFVVELTQGRARLLEFGPDHDPREHPLDLPDDHQLMLEHTTTGGRFDRQRADGTTGDRIERQRYAAAVQDEVVKVVPNDVPLILAASTDLQPAYREVNTHPFLLDAEIDGHPDSVDDPARTAQVRKILDEHYAAELDAWRERFGTLRAQGLATSKFDEVAVAAATAAVDTLHFDMDATEEGRIDEFGGVERAESPGPDTYALVDEIAARVLRSGGSVRAVRNADLLDGSPVAATLRFPLPSE